MTSSLVFAKASWSTNKVIQTPKIVHFSNSQSPARSSKSQLDQQLSLHNSSKSTKNNELVNIFLHCEFAQNELKV
jgi:hypothetical protein